MKENHDVYARKFEINSHELRTVIKKFKTQALIARENRIKPGVDTKLIAGWNGLALAGLCESYQALGRPEILELANKNASFLKSLVSEGKLSLFPDGDLEGFMDDYASVINGFLEYYQTTLNEEYLHLTQSLTDRALVSFYDENEGYFFFTSHQSETLITRNKQIFDSVIPSSNSIMAKNLFYLGTLTYNDSIQNIARDLIAKVLPLIQNAPEHMSNWADMAIQMSSEFAEIVIVGPKYMEFAAELNKQHFSSYVIAAPSVENDAPLFKYKSMLGDETTIFVCFNRSCKLPVTSVEKAIAQLE